MTKLSAMLSSFWTIVAVVLIMTVVAGWGIRQYGNTRESAQEIGNLKEVLLEAQEARTIAIKADAQVGDLKAAKAQEIRAAGNLARKEIRIVQKAPETVGSAECPPDPRIAGLLNDLIIKGNAGIDSTR